MKKRTAISLIFFMTALTMGSALAQPMSGTSKPFGIAPEEMAQIAQGWNARQHILGKSVYNDQGDKIGSADDILITPDKGVAYAVVGVGGFLGMKKHNVLVPVSQFRTGDGGRLTLPGATKNALKAIPAFKYPH